MYTTVIFDLDGTLLNTIQDLADAGNFVCAQRGWPLHSTEEYKKLVGNGIPRLVWRFTPPPFRKGDSPDPAVLQAFLDRYAAHMQDHTGPYPGIPQLLKKLKDAHVQLAVLSNKQDALSKEVVAHYFPGQFDLVRGGRADTPAKPDPTGVFQVLKELSADPAHTLFVGDSDVDILTANHAGLAGCGVLWGFRDEAELTGAGAVHIADTPETLAQLILGL